MNPLGVTSRKKVTAVIGLTVITGTGLLLGSSSRISASRQDIRAVNVSERLSPGRENKTILQISNRLQLKAEIHKFWSKEDFTNRIAGSLSRGNPYVLYDIQIDTNNLLRYAYLSKDIELLNDLAEVYLTAYKYLKTTREGYRAWVCGGPDCILWNSDASRNREIQLVSAQYIYLIANCLNVIAKIDDRERTPLMQEFLESYSSVVTEHIDRWGFGSDKFKSFSVEGWGCENKEIYNHRDFIAKKRDKKLGAQRKYCNAVTSSDLWIIAAAVELLSAHKAVPQKIPLEPYREEELLEYIGESSNLLQSRLTSTQLTDFEGNIKEGLIFDAGVWDDHPDYAYSGYTGESFPEKTDALRAQNVGWDISHGRCLVHVFNTLYENSVIAGQLFPSMAVMQGLANQIVYGTFNRDFRVPLFTNYLDGTNGWYRVNYSGRKNFGYRPYSLSNSIPTGGYGFWVGYNDNMQKIMLSLLDLTETKEKDRVEFHESIYGIDGRNTALILRFLPSLWLSLPES